MFLTIPFSAIRRLSWHLVHAGLGVEILPLLKGGVQVIRFLPFRSSMLLMQEIHPMQHFSLTEQFHELCDDSSCSPITALFPCCD